MPTVNYKIDTSIFQSSSASCWYAAYCMMFSYKNKPTSSIRERIERFGLDYKDFWTNGLPREQYSNVRAALGLAGHRRSYLAGMLDDPEWFADRLKGYGPVWCALSVPFEHAVVISGFNSDTKKITITNPTSDYGFAQVQEMPISEFKRRLGSADAAAALQMVND